MAIPRNFGTWELMILISILIMQFVYFFPVMIAIIKKRSDTLQIYLFNIVLGWTVIGWIVALIWSLISINHINQFKTKFKR